MENYEDGWKLPEEVVTEHILPWLPIKKLIQYKIVSRDWYDSISSPEFTLKYTKQPLIHHPSLPVENLFIQYGNTFYLYSCNENDDNIAANPEMAQSNLVELNADFNLNVGDEMELVGCSKGLVCLAQILGKFFLLYNPATSQFHKFYPADFEIVRKHHPQWGFGYDSVNNDFKVVKILCLNRKIVSVHVYSLKLNMWRKVDVGVDRSCALLGRASLVNDTLYWTMLVRSYSRLEVLAFDLTRETFEIYPHLTFPPDGHLLNLPGNGVLSTMGGCLAKCSSNSRNEVVFEIVKHPGEVVSVCFECDLKIDLDYELVGFTKTGKVLIAHTFDGTLGLLDRGSKQILVTFGYQMRTYIDKYVPSQISPLPSSELPNTPPEGTWAYQEPPRQMDQIMIMD